MNRRSWIQLICAFALPGVVWIALDVYLSRASTLPADVTTIDHYLTRMPPPEKAYLRERDGQRYYVMVGPMPPMPAVPSSHPQYVFDTQGRVVDWTHDVGDDSGYVDRWAGAVSMGGISIEDAVLEMRRYPRPN